MRVAQRNWQDITDDREKYSAYLCSREWAKKRDAARARCGGVCERCRWLPMDHVHHLTYARKYYEELSDLQALCKACHEFTHNKSNYDPAADRPAAWAGRKLQAVYLAGKITGTTWRDEIAPGWSHERGKGNAGWNGGCWTTLSRAAAVPECRPLDMTGPFWCPVSEYAGHSWAPHNKGKHAGAEYINGGVCTDANNVRDNVMLAVSRADLVFVWIDQLDCYGTLLEIGLAKAEGKVICIATSPEVNHRDIWLSLSIADAHVIADSAGAAWTKFWNLHMEKTPRYYPVS